MRGHNGLPPHAADIGDAFGERLELAGKRITTEFHMVDPVHITFASLQNYVLEDFIWEVMD